MLFHESDLDSSQEVPIQPGVDKQDQDFRGLVPYIVDHDEGLRNWWDHVGWNPDDEDCDIYGGYEYNGAPFDLVQGAAVFDDQAEAIDDDLHEQLNLKDP